MSYKVVLTLLVVVALLTSCYFFWPGPPGTIVPTTERKSYRPILKDLASAQAYFRANDCDGNGVKDFWRGDVAGLYGLKDADGKPLALIALSDALADDRAKVDLSPYGKPNPRSGYWYRAIRHANEDRPDPQRFAFCAYPLDPSKSIWTFIIDEYNTIFKKDLRGSPAESFPLDPVAEGWRKLD